MSQTRVPLCSRLECGHPEVVHGGWARPDGACGYHGCACKCFEPPSAPYCVRMGETCTGVCPDCGTTT